MLSYKGYHGKFEVDFESNILHGEVVDVKDVITFQGQTPEELENAFRDSVDDYLAYCDEIGQEPDKPFSGQFLVRADAELHRCLFVAASLKGLSFNQFVVDKLRADLHTWTETRRPDSPPGTWSFEDRGQVPVVRYTFKDVAWLVDYAVSNPDETGELRELSEKVTIDPAGWLTGFAIEQVSKNG